MPTVLGDPNDVQEQLDRIALADAGRPRKNVAILGAGMAGLVAAFELSNLGHSVVVFEGSLRAGGRVHTHRFSDGTYGELGAMRIPIYHHYTRYYAAKMGLQLRPFITSGANLKAFYDLRGRQLRMEDAQSELYPLYNLSTDQRALPIPPAIFGAAMQTVVSSLTDEERLSLLSGRAVSERLLRLDQMSLATFLVNVAGADAADLVMNATGLEQFAGASITMFMRDALNQEGDRLDEIVGGMDLLPSRLFKLAEPYVRFGCDVRSLSLTSADKAQVAVARDGHSPQAEQWDFVLCTLPFSVLRSLDLGDGFSVGKLRAIRTMSYASSTKVLLHCPKRFWEQHYGIFGGASQTDNLNRATYYPSDNVQSQADAVPLHRYSTLYGGYTGGQYSASDPQVAEKPGVLLASYTWGQDARTLGELPLEERVRVVRRCIARIHPEIAEDAAVDDSASMFWDQHRWTGGRTFSFLGPGEQFGLFEDAIRPEGCIYFAGEHCSLDNAWIQGAISSSLRAVECLVSR